MSPPTDEDLELFPHVILTSEGDWDPTVFDNEITLEEVPQVLTNLPPTNVYGDIKFDAYGNYCGVYTGSHTTNPPVDSTDG